ncbi:hypothetical protein ACFWFF_01325 [Streptomyces sp. NPDC060223]|uniref:hypothetical protein n=1 Tax=unclassified Streptomyces TaxID=2593676 RepID=UPI003643CE2B
MDLTAGTKATAVSAVAVMAGGISVILYGIVRNDLARSLGGACLTMTALTLIAMVAIRRWTTDTGDERRILAASTREAQAERSRYVAAQAALENEQARLNRDMAAERARVAATLVAERRKMEAAFEEKRAQLATEAFTTGVQMERAGMLSPKKSEPGNLIQFPQQERAAERERSREHGVVGP